MIYIYLVVIPPTVIVFELTVDNAEFGAAQVTYGATSA